MFSNMPSVDPVLTDKPEGFNPYKAYVSGGFFFFVVLNELVKRYATPLPETATRKTKWKWRNTLVSFVHSVMTGAMSPVAFYRSQSLRDDMIDGYSDMALMLVGEFLHPVQFSSIWHKYSPPQGSPSGTSSTTS